MIRPFLNSIADDIDRSELARLREYCYVFPTRRAGAYFGQILRKKFSNEAFWSPDIYSIEDFIVQLSGKRIASEIELVLELYECYKAFDPDIGFDNFYAWGKIILSDFDEVDRYLVDPEMLYRNLQNLKDIEAVFYSDDAKEALRNFRNSLENSENSILISQFLQTWVKVSEIYSLFQNRLKEKGIAYAGMLYKNLCQQLKNEDYSIGYGKIVFAGFNALTKSEENIIDLLIQSGKGFVYWDCARSFLRKGEEAGSFLRNYYERWPHEKSKWIVSESDTTASKLSIYPCSGAQQQSQLAASLVNSGGWYKPDSAIVLADENLLKSVIFATPDNLKLNITMGYPLKENPFSVLATSFLKLLNVEKTKSGEVYFVKSHFNDFVEHPFIKSIVPKELFPKIGRSYVIAAGNVGELLSVRPLHHINEGLKGKDSFESLEEFLIDIYHSYQEKIDAISREVLYHLVKHLKQLRDSLKNTGLKLGFREKEKLFADSIHSLKIPFLGEPFNGLQIMGFLETRTLDFKNLIILSVNEGVLPSERKYNTYIPFGLRKAYEMPTFEDQDAIYAYHFKRLLIRAQNVHVVYNTQLSYDGSGEVSRFIAQLRHSARKSDISIDEVNVQEDVQENMPEFEASVPKNEQVMSALAKYWNPSGTSFLSPTALLNYLDDPVSFYVKNVLGIHELEEFSDDFDPREIGRFIHKALEDFYMPFQENQINREDYKSVLKGREIEKYVLSALTSEKIITDENELKGKNRLLYSVLSEVVRQVLYQDSLTTPFEILSLETNSLNSSFLISGKEARLGGFVDRIDRKDGVVRILDYKTGKVKLPSAYIYSKLSVEDYVELYFENSEFKSGFQAYFYVFLYKKKYPDHQIRAGIYGLKQVNQGVQYLRNGEILGDELIEAFGNRLLRLVGEILDENIPFRKI